MRIIIIVVAVVAAMGGLTYGFDSGVCLSMPRILCCKD